MKANGYLIISKVFDMKNVLYFITVYDFSNSKISSIKNVFSYGFLKTVLFKNLKIL